MKTLQEVIGKLPPELRQEVEDFAKFLLEKKARKPKGRPRLEWRGALSDMRGKYTSVDLQHKALLWRGD